MKKRAILQVGDLTVDLDTRQVTRNGEEIRLGRLSFDLLEALIRAAPAALSSDEIVQRVWSGDIVTDETVKQRVSLLRRALGQAPAGEYLETLRGFGYRLGVPVEGADDAEPSAPVPEVGPGRLMRTIILILAILSLILLITVLATAVRQVKRLSDGGEGSPAHPTTVVAGSEDFEDEPPSKSPCQSSDCCLRVRAGSNQAGLTARL